jgi:hypothetical protein
MLKRCYKIAAVMADWTYLAVSAVSCLVQSSQTQGTNVASPVVAISHGKGCYGLSANEAKLLFFFLLDGSTLLFSACHRLEVCCSRKREAYKFRDCAILYFFSAVETFVSPLPAYRNSTTCLNRLPS